MPVDDEVRKALAMNAARRTGPVTRASGRSIHGTKILAAKDEGLVYRDVRGTVHVVAIDHLTDELITISF